MIDKKNITGIILAGGKSERMGTDKGFLTFEGKSFTQRIIDALRPLVSEIIIISNNPAYDIFNLKRIHDDIENAGPLAGVYSGLHHSKTEYNLILSCDIPLINTNTLEMLIKAKNKESDIIQLESNGKSMPLIALYKKPCETLFHQLLQQGERRLQFAVNKCKVMTIILDSESDIFTRNVNTPNELKEIKKC